MTDKDVKQFRAWLRREEKASEWMRDKTGDGGGGYQTCANLCRVAIEKLDKLIRASHRVAQRKDT